MRKTRLLVIVLVCACFVLLFSMMFYKASQPINIYMFSDISECLQIDGTESAMVTKYNDSSRDEHLKGLSFVSSYGANYVSDELEFEIFAYEFESCDLSRDYFYNATQIDMDRDMNFYSHQGPDYYTITVINGKNAYRILTSSSMRTAMDGYLSLIFSLKLDVNTTEVLPNVE